MLRSSPAIRKKDDTARPAIGNPSLTCSASAASAPNEYADAAAGRMNLVQLWRGSLKEPVSRISAPRARATRCKALPGR